MESRRKSREQAIQLLYNIEFMGITLEQAIESIPDVTDDAQSFVAHVIYDLSNIDEIISLNLENYTLKRLNAVDRAIIRLAVYELLSGTPKNIVINEALELTKSYSDLGDKKVVRFNNKLLDNIAKHIENNK